MLVENKAETENPLSVAHEFILISISERGRPKIPDPTNRQIRKAQHDVDHSLLSVFKTMHTMATTHVLLIVEVFRHCFVVASPVLNKQQVTSVISLDFTLFEV